MMFWFNHFALQREGYSLRSALQVRHNPHRLRCYRLRVGGIRREEGKKNTKKKRMRRLARTQRRRVYLRSAARWLTSLGTWPGWGRWCWRREGKCWRRSRACRRRSRSCCWCCCWSSCRRRKTWEMCALSPHSFRVEDAEIDALLPFFSCVWAFLRGGNNGCALLFSLLLWGFLSTSRLVWTKWYMREDKIKTFQVNTVSNWWPWSLLFLITKI